MGDTAVIVPVLARPQNAAPFMDSLRASTSQANVYAVANPSDVETIDAWENAGAGVIVADLRTFAEKVNEGYRLTVEPWLFLTGDDVRFHHGWLSNARLVASRYFHVVGTNDLGNPRVTSGQHATHLLIRRTYIDEVGASWDGPKNVCHEGYRHMFVDDEIVAAAKMRGVWAMALSSVVEHLHPMFGKADDDPVYRLGLGAADTDRARWGARCAAYL